MEERTVIPEKRRSTHEQAGQRDPAPAQYEGGHDEGAQESGRSSRKNKPTPDDPHRGERRDSEGEGTSGRDDPGYPGWDQR